MKNGIYKYFKDWYEFFDNSYEFLCKLKFAGTAIKLVRVEKNSYKSEKHSYEFF
jgi:hypothetical protein